MNAPKGSPGSMLILNYSHPLTTEQLADLRTMLGGEPEVRQFRCELDTEQPFAPQITALVDEAGLSAEQWQSTPLLVLLPSLNTATAVLLAELHGRIGYFPAILRLKPASGSLMVRFDIAEVINLQEVRNAARLH